jgi:hypothetical protein
MKGLPYDCASTTNAAQPGKITVLSATILPDYISEMAADRDRRSNVELRLAHRRKQR